MSDQLQLAIEAIKTGAKTALQYYENIPEVMFKPNNSPVTIADKETERVIKEFILKHDKSAKFVGEETGGEISQGSFWVIDPIDGTSSYIRSIPQWGNLLAYCENGNITLGVSNVPTQHELLYAEKGKGAFLNDKKVHVSKVAKLKDSFMSFGSTNHFKNPQIILKVNKLASAAKGFGDCFCYHLLANGRIDGMIEEGFSIWDFSPFKIIIDEAGGKSTTFIGADWQITDDNVIASNGLIHDEIRVIINQ